MTLERSTAFTGSNAAAWPTPGGSGWAASTDSGVLTSITDDIQTNAGRHTATLQASPRVALLVGSETNNTDYMLNSNTGTTQTYQTATTLAAEATGAVILVQCITNSTAGAPTATGLSLVWTQVATQIISGNKRQTVFRAAGTWSAGRITFDVGAGNTSTGWLVQLQKFIYSDITTPVVQSKAATGSSNSATLTLDTTVRLDTAVAYFTVNAGNVSSNSANADTQLIDNGNSTVGCRGQAGWVAPGRSAAAQTAGQTPAAGFGSSQSWAAVAVEVAPSQTGAAVVATDRLWDAGGYSGSYVMDVRARITYGWAANSSRPGVYVKASDGTMFAVLGTYDSVKTLTACVAIATRAGTGLKAWTSIVTVATSLSADAFIWLRIGPRAAGGIWYAVAAGATAPTAFTTFGTTTALSAGPWSAGLIFTAVPNDQLAWPPAAYPTTAPRFDDFEIDDYARWLTTPPPSVVQFGSMIRAGRW